MEGQIRNQDVAIFYSCSTDRKLIRMGLDLMCVQKCIRFWTSKFAKMVDVVKGNLQICTSIISIYAPMTKKILRKSINFVIH